MNQVIKALSTNDVMEHLRALMEVASYHHNSRSIWNGYNASAEYIIHQLENSGACDLTTQPFSVSIWEKIQETEFIVLTASGDVVVFKDQQDFISMAESLFLILTPSTFILIHVVLFDTITLNSAEDSSAFDTII